MADRAHWSDLMNSLLRNEEQIIEIFRKIAAIMRPRRFHLAGLAEV
jgi:hypothetical protein